MPRICVFCGSSPGQNPIYKETAIQLGHAMVSDGYDLVYGGGNIGLMGTVANAVLDKGGRVTGVIPYGLLKREVGHIDVSDLHIVDSMHERKAKMAELSDAFIALPGGFGTYEELFEIVTWNQLGIYRKPSIILNTNDFYAGLKGFLDHAHSEGFIKADSMRLLSFASTVDEALHLVKTAVPHDMPQWLSKGET